MNNSHAVQTIAQGIVKLDPPDYQPSILIQQDATRLVVIRDGTPQLYRISKSIAAELIAAGFSYGS